MKEYHAHTFADRTNGLKFLSGLGLSVSVYGGFILPEKIPASYPIKNIDGFASEPVGRLDNNGVLTFFITEEPIVAHYQDRISREIERIKDGIDRCPSESSFS